MKYLVLVKRYFEEDNNTPARTMLAKVVELKDTELEKAEQKYIDKFYEGDTSDVDVDFFPLSGLERKWGVIDEVIY